MIIFLKKHKIQWQGLGKIRTNGSIIKTDANALNLPIKTQKFLKSIFKQEEEFIFPMTCYPCTNQYQEVIFFAKLMYLSSHLEKKEKKECLSYFSPSYTGSFFS